MQRPPITWPNAEPRYAFGWDDVEPRRAPPSPDELGLNADDRRVLGLAAARLTDAAAPAPVDAASALRDLLLQGAALGKGDRPRR